VQIVAARAAAMYGTSSQVVTPIFQDWLVPVVNELLAKVRVVAVWLEIK
jgi:hypothetical protein